MSETDGMSAGPSAGQLLRDAREAAGLHIAALAVSLKVPVRKLEALEADRLEELPDAVFARALASSVCRALHVDPAPILDRLPQGHATLVPQRDAGINAPFRGVGGSPKSSVLSSLARPAAWLVALLLVGVVALLLWPASRGGRAPGAAGGETRELISDVVPAAAAPSAPASETVLPSDGPSMAEAPTAAAAAPAGGASAPAVAAAPALPAGATPLVAFTATGTSWIEVRDARGSLTLQRTLQAGERAEAGGTLPLSVVVGRADATRVQVRGADIDLATRARDNVARFEVR
jgi:cytoskeleton protein RodZ